MINLAVAQIHKKDGNFTAVFFMFSLSAIWQNHNTGAFV